MVSGLDHCLTSNLTAVQCIGEVSVSLHLMQCVCVWEGGGGGGGGVTMACSNLLYKLLNLVVIFYQLKHTSPSLRTSLFLFFCRCSVLLWLFICTS